MGARIVIFRAPRALRSPRILRQRITPGDFCRERCEQLPSGFRELRGRSCQPAFSVREEKRSSACSALPEIRIAMHVRRNHGAATTYDEGQKGGGGKCLEPSVLRDLRGGRVSERSVSATRSEASRTPRSPRIVLNATSQKLRRGVPTMKDGMWRPRIVFFESPRAPCSPRICVNGVTPGDFRQG